MASRLHKWSSIHARVSGLIRHGGIKEANIPLWYVIYEHFPPIEEPAFGRPIKDVKIRDIFYKEDNVRAKIHDLCSHNLGIIDLCNSEVKTKSQEWIKIYEEHISSGGTEEAALGKIRELCPKPGEKMKSKLNLSHVLSEDA